MMAHPQALRRKNISIISIADKLNNVKKYKKNASRKKDSGGKKIAAAMPYNGLVLYRNKSTIRGKDNKA